MFVYTWSDHHCRSSACGPASLCCRLYKESNMDIWDLSRLPACVNLNSQTERQLLTQDGKLSQQAGLAQLGGSVDQGTHFYNEEKIKPVTSFSYSMLTTKTFCRWRGRRCSVSWGILPSVRPISTPSPSCWRWASTPRGRQPSSSKHMEFMQCYVMVPLLPLFPFSLILGTSLNKSSLPWE